VVWAGKLPLRELIPEVLASEHPPTFNIISHYWGYLGHSEAWVRSLSAIFGIVTILLVYAAGKELFSRRAGLWAAAFAAMSPLLIWYSQDATSYSWIIASSFASLWLLVRSVARGGWRNWTAFTAVAVFAIVSHFYTLSLVAALVVVYLVLRRKGDGSLKPWLVSAAVQLVTLAGLMALGLEYSWGLEIADPFAYDTLDTFMRGLARAPMVLLFGYGGLVLGGAAALPLLGHRPKQGWIAAGIGLAAVFAIPGTWRTFVNRRSVAIGLYTVIMVAGPVAVLLLRSAEVSGRYYAWAAPPLMVLGGMVVATAPRKIGAVAGTMVLAGLLMSTLYQFDRQLNEDWRGLMGVIAEERQPGDSILCFPEHNCVVAVDFYLPEDMRVRGGFLEFDMDAGVLGTFFRTGKDEWFGYRKGFENILDARRLSGAELEGRLERDLAESERVWLVAGLEGLGHYPRAEEVEAALRPHWTVEEVHELDVLVLKLYVRRA
jgi:4-amino-4-deoxy-L-arabinose transferase-like glycosyltransferase